MSAAIERDRRRIDELNRRLAEHKRRYGSATPAPRDLQADALNRKAAELDRRLAEHKRRYGAARSNRDTRTPAQKLVQLRRDFGDERRNSALWDTLPMLLQRHWADAKRAAGETLAPVERRALDYSPRELATIRYEVRA